jgi:hypothetical protein
MKLRKQAPLKAALFAVTAALIAGLFAVFRAGPPLDAAPAGAGHLPDYNRFFAPANQPPAAGGEATQPALRPHTRTRAS